MSKHTPGPWTLLNGYDIFSEFGADSGDGYKAPENDGWLIATVELGSVINDEGEFIEISHGVARANARLIAATPDLYDVCERLIDALPYVSEYDVPLGLWDDIHAAMAKARGEA